MGYGKLVSQVSNLAGYYAKIKTGIKFTPPLINYLVTNKCDLKCRHCWLYDDLNVKEVKDLTIEEIDRFSRTMDRIYFLVIAGGEPFVRRDLPELMAKFYWNTETREFAILTDAQFTNRMCDFVPRMLDSMPGARLALSMSLDGLEEDHDRIRGREGAFKKYQDTYSAMKEIQKSYPDRLKLMTCSIFMSETQDKVSELYDWIKGELKPDHINFNLIRQEPEFPHLKQVNLNLYRELIEQQNSDDLDAMRKGENGPVQMTAIMTRELIAKTALENQKQLDCYAGYTGGVIYNDGTVAGCEIKQPFGNLRQYDYDFKKVWFNDRAKDFRSKLKDCFCTHESDCMMPSIAFNPKLYPRMWRLSKGASAS
ncbi:MAG TPA: radical SAM protein [Blastocatellia bacterium]|nr:radical SAM protein [Blastocatellia bacterium]